MSVPVSVAPASLRHLPALAALFRRAVETDFNYFPPAVIAQTLAQGSLLRLGIAILKPQRVVLVAREGSTLIGFLIGSVPDDKNAQIYWLYVSDEGRGKGVGSRLLQVGIESMKARGARQVSLETHNRTQYYLERGFRVVREEPDKYDGIGMCLLVLDIDEKAQES